MSNVRLVVVLEQLISIEMLSHPTLLCPYTLVERFGLIVHRTLIFEDKWNEVCAKYDTHESNANVSHPRAEECAQFGDECWWAKAGEVAICRE